MHHPKHITISMICDRTITIMDFCDQYLIGASQLVLAHLILYVIF